MTTLVNRILEEGLKDPKELAEGERRALVRFKQTSSGGIKYPRDLQLAIPRGIKTGKRRYRTATHASTG